MPAAVPLRSRIGDGLWAELLAGAPVIRATAGTIICRRGSPPHLAAVIDGLVRVFTWAPDGHQVPLQYARPGDLVGLAALLGGAEKLSAEAVTDTAHATVSVDHLHVLAARHPELAWKVVEEVATWGLASVATLVGAACEPVHAQVARHLLDLAVPASEGRTIAYVTHCALADAVGTARDVITRVLGEFQEQGIVDASAGRVVVLEPGRLARITEGEDATVHEECGVRQADLAGLGTIPPG
jgi:CRP/FNR family cyclic AMP-dependent transcriptional regulator